MRKITWNTKTLKRVEKIGHHNSQKTFKSLDLLLADKENNERIQAKREIAGAKKIELILI